MPLLLCFRSLFLLILLFLLLLFLFLLFFLLLISLSILSFCFINLPIEALSITWSLSLSLLMVLLRVFHLTVLEQALDPANDLTEKLCLLAALNFTFTLYLQVDDVQDGWWHAFLESLLFMIRQFFLYNRMQTTDFGITLFLARRAIFQVALQFQQALCQKWQLVLKLLS